MSSAIRDGADIGRVKGSKMTNIEILLDLIKENPELPILPMVDSEVVGDDSYTWWLGEWGKAEILHYYMGAERVHIKEFDDEEDVLYDLNRRDYSDDDIYDLSDEELDKLYESIPWAKAIMVKIGV